MIFPLLLQHYHVTGAFSKLCINQGWKVYSPVLVCRTKSQCSKVWAKFSYQPKRKDRNQVFDFCFGGTPKTFNGFWRRARAPWLAIPCFLCRDILCKCFSPSTLRLLPFLFTQKLHSQTPRMWGRVLLSHISWDLWDKGFFFCGRKLCRCY